MSNMIPIKKTKHLMDESPVSSTHENINSRGENVYNVVSYKNSFVQELRVEMQRAQRSGSALSVHLLKHNKPSRTGLESARETWKVIGNKIRETDVIGFVDEYTLGVILPYTDENGAKRSAEKIKSNFINPNFIMTTSTYPDEIFDSLIKSGGVSSNIVDLMIEDSIERSWFWLAIKRVIDIVGSLFALIFFSPVMLVTALLIKLGSPGSVIFKQTRLGTKGTPFTFYKFRSMYIDSNDQIHRDYVNKLISGKDDSINNGDAEKPLFKIKSDPRVTVIGKFIRKTSIDELPQFYNVLKGDMSLVGPRPPLAYEVEKYKPWHLRRVLEMKPGITGLWQVEGRGRTEFDEAVRLDVRYLKTWSLFLDFKILVNTVKEVLQCRGAV